MIQANSKLAFYQASTKSRLHLGGHENRLVSGNLYKQWRSWSVAGYLTRSHQDTFYQPLFLILSTFQKHRSAKGWLMVKNVKSNTDICHGISQQQIKNGFLFFNVNQTKNRRFVYYVTMLPLQSYSEIENSRFSFQIAGATSKQAFFTIPIPPNTLTSTRARKSISTIKRPLFPKIALFNFQFQWFQMNNVTKIIQSIPSLQIICLLP